MMKIEEICPGLEKLGFLQTDGLPQRADADGSVYETICCGGIKEEGRRIPVWYAEPEAAVNDYLRELLAYLRGRTHIVWRQRPQLMELELKTSLPAFGAKDSVYAVYSRLVAYPKEVS